MMSGVVGDTPPFTKVIMVLGVGEFPRKGDFVTVHCTGYGKGRDLGCKFWSTRDDGEEQFKFQLGGGDVIEGWEQVLLTMRVGERSEYVVYFCCRAWVGGCRM